MAASISINRLPLFDGSNHQFRSNHMSIFMWFYDYEMWDVVLDDHYTTIVNQLNKLGRVIPKDKLVKRLLKSLPKA